MGDFADDLSMDYEYDFIDQCCCTDFMICSACEDEFNDDFLD